MSARQGELIEHLRVDFRALKFQGQKDLEKVFAKIDALAIMADDRSGFQNDFVEFQSEFAKFQ